MNRIFGKAALEAAEVGSCLTDATRDSRSSVPFVCSSYAGARTHATAVNAAVIIGGTIRILHKINFSRLAATEKQIDQVNCASIPDKTKSCFLHRAG
jgi:hypothetical protein